MHQIIVRKEQYPRKTLIERSASGYEKGFKIIQQVNSTSG